MLKKKWNSDTCNNMDEACKHYAQGNKPVTTGQTLYPSTSMRCHSEVTVIETDIEWWFPAAGERGGWGVIDQWVPSFSLRRYKSAADGQWWRLYNTVHACAWLKWYISYYMYFTIIKKVMFIVRVTKKCRELKDRKRKLTNITQKMDLIGNHVKKQSKLINFCTSLFV